MTEVVIPLTTKLMVVLPAIVVGVVVTSTLLHLYLVFQVLTPFFQFF